MRLSRLFGGGKPDEPREPEPTDPSATEEEAEAGGDDGVPEDGEFEGVPEGDPDADLDLPWRVRAADVIPGGASTGSKRAAALYGEWTDFVSTYYARASGCHVTTAGGRTPGRPATATRAMAIDAVTDSASATTVRARLLAVTAISGVPPSRTIRLPAGRLVTLFPYKIGVTFVT